MPTFGKFKIRMEVINKDSCGDRPLLYQGVIKDWQKFNRLYIVMTRGNLKK